jgi:lipoprotein-anchoring transpeptidase ErfK/SrfK
MLRREFLISAAVLAAAGPAAAQVAPKAFELPEEYKPRIVRVRNVPPNEIHVVPQEFALYWTQPEGKAIRYAVGIGREGLYEPGVFYVGAKKEWPSWTPTQEMIDRNPAAYKRWEEGMPGGPGNPLGSRAIYLFTLERGDTFLRIHGTTEPQTIGSRVSNGCVRLVNSHITHLYDQVPMQARVVLHDV